MKFVQLALIAAICVASTPSTAAKSISIVTFNVENLFDTTDDPTNPRDDTYLPLSTKESLPGHATRCEELNRSGFFRRQCKTLDWSEEVYTAKLQRIASVLNAMSKLPDVVVLPETENRQVLDDLVSKHFRDAGYAVIQLDTSDKPHSRGIDVGIITRLPVIGAPKAHVIDFKNDEDLCGATRDIVEAKLRLPDGEALTVFGVHFPSGSNPFRCRVRAFKFLSGLSEKVPAGELVLAAGDFNINCNETTSPAFQRLLRRANWFVSPVAQAGCSAPGSSKFVDHLNDFWHTWSFLDLIIVRQELSPTRASEKNWFADLGSLSTLVVHPEQVMTDEDDKGFVEPRRFDPATQRGVSDHWPVGMRLIPRRKYQEEEGAEAAPFRVANPEKSTSALQTLKSRRDLRWLRRSAEYAVLTRQAYLLAESNLKKMLRDHVMSEPWVVAMDADETILDNSQGEVETLPKPLYAGFDENVWRGWVRQERADVIPGAREFLERVISMGGRIAVITNRDHDQDHHTRQNLKAVGIDYPPESLCVLGRSNADRHEHNKEEWKRYGYRNDKDRRRRLVARGQAQECWSKLPDGIDKTTAQAAWSQGHRIMMYVGDNIKDFPRVTPGIADSSVAMREIASNPRFVILPNPTYGSSWEKRKKRADW